MLIFPSFALLYMVSSLSLFATVLSRSCMDLCTISFCLLLAVWYTVFCYHELKSPTGEPMRDVFDQQLNDLQVLGAGKGNLLPAEQLDDFSRQYELTEREREILHLILLGKSNQEISEALYITVGTVKAHVHSIFGKLDVSRRSQLITRFLEGLRLTPLRRYSQHVPRQIPAAFGADAFRSVLSSRLPRRKSQS